jgi:hypothetical protein
MARRGLYGQVLLAMITALAVLIAAVVADGVPGVAPANHGFNAGKRNIASPPRPVRSQETATHIVLENGYTKISIDKRHSQVDFLGADFLGQSDFSKNVLAKPVGLEIKSSNTTSRCAALSSAVVNVKWTSQTDALQSVSVSLVDCASDPSIRETWTVSVAAASRAVDIRFDGTVVRDLPNVQAILHGFYLSAPSVYGLFDRGVGEWTFRVFLSSIYTCTF